MTRPAVYLDRDGVLTEPVVVGGRERPPWTDDELRIVPGARSALDGLRSAGFLLIGITNQPDIARGDVDGQAIGRINDVVVGALGLDAMYVCPHDSADGCACRKPLPGMIHDAAQDLGVDLGRSWLIGDRWVDIAAGRSAGLRTVLLARAGSWQPTSAGAPPPELRPGLTVSTLDAATTAILGATDGS